MDIKIRVSMLSCIAACMLTVAVPLVSEATYGGKGADDGYLELPFTDEESPPPEEITQEPPSVSLPDTNYEPPSYSGDMTVRVLDTEKNEIVEMKLDDYITCVVAAEMPYTFNSEALKAQAVAARSYCMYKILNGSGHDGADICTSYSHCAAFVSEDELTKKYGESTAKKILNKVSAAVSATSGEIISYEGKPALALFHSRSFEYTESSENVWGGKLPYLTSVSTPEDDSISTVTVSKEKLKEIFNSAYSVQVSNQTASNKLTSEQNSSGRQSSLFYKGRELKAKKLRTLLDLKSCDFEFKETAEGWVFTVHGYGHGVGMSQYGANEMAKNGYNYKDILTHYYRGVTLENLNLDA
ncbi:MAG: stage II sporulation protein D [Clostridia bacterium]|nr:stage II sporulation protein D [Clostridia bacterium]